MNNPDDLSPQKLVKKMDAYSTLISDVPLPKKLADRLATFISVASNNKIKSSEVVIAHVLHSAYNLNDMVDLVGNNKERLFTPRQCEAIISCLKRVYDINYYKERAAFLNQHRGVQTFVAQTDIPNKARYSIYRELGDYNCTISNLLVSKKDFRRFSGVGNTTITCVMLLCEQDGVNFWQYFPDD